MSRGRGAIAVALAILLLIVVFAPVPGDTRLLGTLHDAAHGPLFGCVALLILAWQRRTASASSRSWAVQYAIALGGAIVLGVATEIAQALTGGDASLLDVRNDALGALALLMLAFAFERRTRSTHALRTRVAAACVALGVFAFLFAPLVAAGLEYRHRNQQFPVIADFTSSYDRYFIYQHNAEFAPIAVPARWARREGEQAMHVRLLPGEYPGMNFTGLVPDWTAYGELVLDMTNPGSEDLRLRLRIHDAIHTQAFDDRYNGLVTLRAGHRETIRIPLDDVRNAPRGRTLQLDDVAGMMMFQLEPSEHPSRPEFFLSRVWLE